MGLLTDKEDLKQIKRRERKELAALRAEIPADVQADNELRRKLNIQATELLLHGVESDNFGFMLIGRDDTAPFSQAHLEARKMDILVNELPKEKILFFSGADQLGIVLLTRAVNKLSFDIPMVKSFYGAGKGAEIGRAHV